MKKGLLSLLSLLAIFGLLSSCGSSKGYQASDISYIYDSRELAPRPNFVVYHLNEEQSEIHYRINAVDLLYMRDAVKNDYYSEVKIRYQVIPSFENTTVLDSGSIDLTDRAQAPPQKALIGNFTVNTPREEKSKQFVVKITLTDLNRNVSFDNFLRLNKTSELGNQYYLLTDTSGQVIFKNHVPKGVPIQIHHSRRDLSRSYVSVYKRDFPIALPPYSSMREESFDLSPDTTYVLNLSRPLSLAENAFYHIRLDTSQWDGFTLYSFYDEFPFVARRLHMAPPLRYLTTKREFEELASALEDPAAAKEVVDDFWLKRAGSIERSQMLVEAYYSRVQEANMFFSSYLEGWKTDRGIIYTVYGPPDKVYRSSTGESWVYGDENSSLSYLFSFLKVSNPFTDNDYSLDRSGSYRYGWGQAIESWRNGHVYNSNDIKQEQNEQEQNRYRQRPPYWY